MRKVYRLDYYEAGRGSITPRHKVFGRLWVAKFIRWVLSMECNVLDLKIKVFNEED